MQLLGPGAVHLLTDQPFDLAHGPPADGRKAVEAGGQRRNEPGPEQQLVARELRFGGCLPQRFEEELAQAHWRYRIRPTLPLPGRFGQGRRGLCSSALSIINVTGPSFTLSTCMCAPKRPRSQRTPAASRAAQKRS